MQKPKQSAFTLVELIVVITILAILGTIAFISLQGYSATSRDSVRIADVGSMSTALEIFQVNSGKYPVPDNGGFFTYLGDPLWTQGNFGENVVKNLSRNFSKAPTDPLSNKEYIYSRAGNGNEFQLLNLLEGDIVLNTISQTNAAESVRRPKVGGTYNGLYIKTKNYLVPLPSILTSLDYNEGDSSEISGTGILSQVITGGTNIPNIGGIKSGTGGITGLELSVANVVTSDSTSTEKAAAMQKIQDAYSGSSLKNDGIYEYILSVSGEDNLADLLETVVLNNAASVVATKNIETVDNSATIFDITVAPSYLNVSNYTYRTMFYIPEFQSLYYMNDDQSTSAEIKRIYFPDINDIQTFTESSISAAFNEGTSPNNTSRGTFYYNNNLYQTGYSNAFIRKFSVNSATDFVQTNVTNISHDAGGSWGLAIDEANSRILMSGDTGGSYPSWVPFNLSTGTVSTSASNATEFGGKGYQGAIGIDPLSGYYYIAETYSSNQIHEFDENQNFIRTFTVDGLSGIGAITITDKHLFVSADNTNLAKIYYWER